MPMNKILKDPKLSIILLQCTAVLIIILSVSTVKALGGSVYNEFSGWYKENFMSETSVNEVLKETENTPDETEKKPTVVITNTAPVLNETKKETTVQTNVMLWPVSGTVTSEFGGRADPFTNAPATHQGIDIAINSGTDVLAAMSGTVTEVGYEENGYGNFVKIRHSGGFDTLYAHCSKITVKEGEEVRVGQCVAKSGNTGKSTGPHLHFETIVGGTALDPRWFLSK